MDRVILAKMIDHTLLKPEATTNDFRILCREATENKFYSVCVPPQWVAFAKDCLGDSGVKVVAVVGFPHGNTLTQVKVSEAQAVIDAGADEIDMVAQIGRLKDEDSDAVRRDIEDVVKASKVKKSDIVVKVILETAALRDVQKVLGCRLAAEAGAHFVKTSTGFHPTGGATLMDVALLRENTPREIGVKAAGGIRDLKTALAMIAAGATRLGCSASVSILNELTTGAFSTATEADVSARKRLQHEYAWRWFAFHASQRALMFNYFVAVVAGIGVTFGYLVARAPSPLWFHAFAVATTGCLMTVAFMGIDARNRDLVHRAERVLQKLEEQDIFRAEAADPAFGGLLLRDKGMLRGPSMSEGPRWSKVVRHGVLIRSIQVIVFLSFLAAALGALYSEAYGPDSQRTAQSDATRQQVHMSLPSTMNGVAVPSPKAQKKSAVQ